MPRFLRKAARIVPLVAIVASLFATAPTAGAATPTIVRSGVVNVDLKIPAGAFCTFALNVHLRFRTTAITFVDRDGDAVRGLQTGRLEAWVTNPKSGITLYQNIPGPSFFDGGGLLIRGTGPWSGIQTVDGVTISATGNIRFNADGLVTSVRGRVEEVCPQLV
jgi:hypothetical protein